MVIERKQGNTAGITIQQGAYLVYIAGIHVPVSSVDVQFSFLSFSTASITLPADKELVKLGDEDRVPVVIFYLDKWYSPTDPTTTGVTPTWRLLFDGDITQFSYNRSPYNRTISFNAISHIAVMNFMSIIYLTGKGREAMEAKSLGDVESVRVGRFAALQVLSFFKKGAYGNSEITRPMDFVKNLLVGLKIGGPPRTDITTELIELDKKLKDINSSEISADDFKELRLPNAQVASASSEFFVKYNHRNKIDKRWIASLIEDVALIASGTQNTTAGREHPTNLVELLPTISNDVTSVKVQDEQFVALMKRMVFDGIQDQFSKRMSTQNSFWNLVEVFYQEALYNIIQVPTAQFVHVDDATDIPSETSSDHARLANCLSVPNLAFGLSPACNILTPAMVSGFGYVEDYASQNTRVLVDGTFIDPLTKFSKDPHALSAGSMRFGYPADQHRVLEDERQTKRSPENILIYPEEYYKGPVVSRPKAPSYFLTIEQTSLFQRKSDKTKADKLALAKANGDTSEKNTEFSKATKTSAKEWRQELLYGFAKSFYLESKYSARNGSINLAFTPYMIPGMTFTMLDNADYDQFHLTGLVTGISIHMSNASVSTSMSYTAGRTLKEVYEQVFTENTFGPDVGVSDRDVDTEISEIYTTAPIIPIRTLANTLQVDEAASTYYRSLLYSKDKVENIKLRPFVFRHSQYFETTSGSSLQKDANGNAIPSNIKEKLNNKVFPGTITNVVPSDDKKGIRRFDLDLRVTEAEYENLDDYELSMRRSSRPICSLDDYMQMFNTSDFYKLAGSVLEGSEEFGVEYPVRLRVYVVNPDELGDNYIRPFAKDKDSFTDQASELRRDWPSKLLAYRERVKNNTILGK